MSTPEKPTEPGNYITRCDETDYDPHIVRVFRLDDELWVEDSDIGTRPLDMYAYNLTNLTWEKV